MKTVINGGCTPSINVFLELDPNENGLPVVWLSLESNFKESMIHAPLNKEAVGKLLVELSRLIGEM